jgi:hypothetical protein
MGLEIKRGPTREVSPGKKREFPKVYSKFGEG